MKRLAIALAVIAALWLGGLVVAGFVLEGRVRGGVAARMTESLGAEATIARGGLGLVRGELVLEELAVRRDGLLGKLDLAIARIDCALPPLGAALIDGACRALAIRGVRLEVSAAALVALPRPERPPLAVQRVEIDDARLVLSPSALVPGLGRVAVDIVHAEAGPTVWKTPLSWLFALRALDATVALPGDVTLRLRYDAGKLRVSGGAYGATPVELPLALPVADLADDARGELAKLIALGRQLAGPLLGKPAE